MLNKLVTVVNFIGSSYSLFTTWCQYLFLKVTVKVVTKRDNKADYCHSPVL